MRIRLLALAPLLFAGCAHIPNDLGVAEVQTQAQERSAAALALPAPDVSSDSLAALLDAPLTPQSAAQIALLRNPEAAAIFAELGLSRADLVEAGTLPNPSLGAIARFPIDGGSGTLLDLDGGFPLVDALMLPLRRSIEEQHFERAKLHAADRVLALVSEARLAWYEAVAAQLEQSILADAQEAAGALADLARAQYDAGNLSRLERLGHESAAVQARLDARAAAAHTVAAEQELRRVLGLHPDDPEWFLMPSLPPAPAFKPDLDAIEAAALNNRLDLAAADHEIEAMRRALRMTKRFRFIPALDLGVSAEREFDGEWSLGPSLDFELPLFDRKRGAVLRFESLVALAAAGREALEASIRAEVATLAEQLNAAAETSAAYRDELLPIHRDLVAETQLHYNGMLIGVYELLTAKRDELEAHRGAIQAQLEYWRTRTQLERAIAGALPDAAATPPIEEAQSVALPEVAPGQNQHEHHEHNHDEE